MIVRRPAEARGQTSAGWLESRHSFSFGDYHDAAHMGFGALRVINEDRIAGGRGFPPHSHANVEILSFEIAGGLAHRDNQGGGAKLGPGDVQWMSAGHGIRHSEFNAHAGESAHFLQVWIQPDRLNAPPAYIDRHFAPALRADRWCLVAAPDGTSGTLPIRQDARASMADLAAGSSLDYPLDSKRRAWLQVVSGSVLLDGERLKGGDGAAITSSENLSVTAASNASLLLFDLA